MSRSRDLDRGTATGAMASGRRRTAALAGRAAWRSVWSALAPFVGLLVVVAIFGAYQELYKPDKPFLVESQLKLIPTQSTIVALGALGMTLVIISGGIDLSVGSILAICSVSLALLLKNGLGIAESLALTLAIGLVCGAVNGLLVTGLRLVPFIVTLGTMLLFRGVAEWISDQGKVQADAPAWMEALTTVPPRGSWLFVPVGTWFVVALACLLAFALHWTVFGRYVFAIGSNEAAARLCGIRVWAVKIAVYALCGLIMGAVGIYSFSYLGMQGDPRDGVGIELQMIAAVVIGGGSLSGGRGSVLGSIVGALTMTTLRNGCRYAEVSDPIQQVVVGGIIIAAVAIDQVLHRNRA